jgi:imidazolonepropionase-like amidohydrolase
MPIGMDNLVRAYRAGVVLAAGTDSGNLLLIHGPSLHRELQLWAQAGVPADAALRAATWSAAKALRAEGRIGSIAKGRDATLLMLDGNPLQDISATERISVLYYKGERIGRSGLFEDENK